MLARHEFKKQLELALHSNITLNHPIFDELLSGSEPKWGLLKIMGLQGWQLTKNFLTYIEHLFWYCPLKNHRKRLLVNMYEEETGGISNTKNHVELMKDFLRAINVSDAERDNEQPLPSTKELIDYRMQLVKSPEKYHLGAAAIMIASEGQNLETKASEARHELLPRIYNLGEKDLLFFSVHQAEDVGHVNDGYRLVLDLCKDAAMQEEAIHVVDHTCKLFNGMYEGIYNEYKKMAR